MPHQPGKSSDPGHPQATSHRVEETPEEILEYWTPERMAHSKPAERTLQEPDPAEGPTEDQVPDQDRPESG